MSRATLAVLLSKLQRFPEPKMHLEQYPTPSEAAATILWDAHTRGLLAGKHILDLGAGTGILGIGALMLGAKVTFMEIDESLKEVIEANIALLQEETDNKLDDYDIIVADAHEGDLPAADLIITNPPFGTKEKHADTRLLEQAYQNCKECYSFHKRSTDAYLQGWFEQRGIIAIQRFPFLFDLPATMQQHEKRSHKVHITCWHTRKDL